MRETIVTINDSCPTDNNISYQNTNKRFVVGTHTMQTAILTNDKHQFINKRKGSITISQNHNDDLKNTSLY